MKTLRKTPDDLWAEIEPLIPPRPERSKGGRPPVNDHQLFDGLFYLLRTGAAWRAYLIFILIANVSFFLFLACSSPLW